MFVMLKNKFILCIIFNSMYKITVYKGKEKIKIKTKIRRNYNVKQSEQQ